MKIMSNKLERNSFSGKENLPPDRVIGLEALAVSVNPKFAQADKAIPREVVCSNFWIWNKEGRQLSVAAQQ